MGLVNSRSDMSHSETTVTDESALRRKLFEIRRQRVADCWQEHEIGLCCMAVPSRNHSRRVIGSVALASSSAWMT